MSKLKILDHIPENLKESLIEEVKELLAEEAKKNKKTPEQSQKEIEASILEWAKASQPKNNK